jgi:hypothetical protein
MGNYSEGKSPGTSKFLLVVVQFDKEASQTRDYCVAAFLSKSCATLRSARPDPLRLRSGQAFTAQRTLVQDDKQMQRYPTSPCESVLLARDWPEGVQVGGAAEDSAVVRDFGGGGIEAVDLDVVGTG